MEMKRERKRNIEGTKKEKIIISLLVRLIHIYFPVKTAAHLIDYFLEVIPQVDRWQYHDHRKKGCT